MPLPSQQPRNGTRAIKFSSSGGGGRRGGRRAIRRRRVGATILIVGALLLAWWFWPSGDGKTPLEPRQASAEGVSSGVTPVRSQRSASPPPAPKVDANESALAARSEQRLTQAAKAQERAGATPPATQPSASSSTGAPSTFVTPSPSEAPAKQDPIETVTPEPVSAPPPPQTTPAFTGGASSQAIARADAAISRNDPVEARGILNLALHDPNTPERDRAAIRERMTEISETLTFSPRILPGDVTADAYVVQSGDVMAAIPRREGFRIDYRLIQRLNQITDPNRIRPGQKLKVLYGPFHAVIDKSDFRMDIYADQRDSAGNRIYIRSFRVGLGEYGLTPVGEFRVPPSSVQEKLINPSWVNPRTGEKFAADNPKNPIGDRWIPLEGLDDGTRDLRGYGIHGTVQPESIGKEMSMGCIRMLPEDVEIVYELLVPERSTVQIID